MIERSLVPLPVLARLCNNSGQVFHTLMFLSPSTITWGTGQWMVATCDWEGNRRSYITLTMRYRLQRSNSLRAQYRNHLWTQSLQNGDEHPNYSQWSIALFTFTTTVTKIRLNHEWAMFLHTGHSETTSLMCKHKNKLYSDDYGTL